MKKKKKSARPLPGKHRVTVEYDDSDYARIEQARARLQVKTGVPVDRSCILRNLVFEHLPPVMTGRRR